MTTPDSAAHQPGCVAPLRCRYRVICRQTVRPSSAIRSRSRAACACNHFRTRLQRCSLSDSDRCPLLSTPRGGRLTRNNVTSRPARPCLNGTHRFLLACGRPRLETASFASLADALRPMPPHQRRRLRIARWQSESLHQAEDGQDHDQGQQNRGPPIIGAAMR